MEIPRPRDGRRRDGPSKTALLREEARQRRGPSLREKAVALAREKGTVRTKDLEAIGVHRQYPAKMCREGLLEKVGLGLYRAANHRAESGDAEQDR